MRRTRANRTMRGGGGRSGTRSLAGVLQPASSRTVVGGRIPRYERGSAPARRLRKRRTTAMPAMPAPSMSGVRATPAGSDRDPVLVLMACRTRRLIGLDEIAEFTRRVLPGAMENGTVEYRVEHVRFVTPDIALTGVAQQYLDAAGQPLEPPALGSPSYVWQRTDGTWKIIIAQNTTFSST
ncbi:uncharacterized protein (TIGR02246 family) [Pseudonocardia autotrophica]|nr:uncharacterized protein (TIGR02246 family) [Pseudonocardia autotrophica]